MASLEFYGKDEYGNGNSINLPDFTGCLLLATTPTPPAGTLVADGSEVSREAYAKLFAIFGTQYGAGDGVSTFALPDWRDEFPRFNGTGRVVGTTQQQAIMPHYHNLQFLSPQTSESYSGLFLPGMNEPTHDSAFVLSGVVSQTYNYKGIATNLTDNQGNPISTDGENRPRNVAFLPCVIYV